MRIFSRAPIAVVELFGVIGSGSRMAALVHLLEIARESRRVRAVVLDIDSPGGAATTSQHLFLALSRVAARKPVVAFVRGYATSGAYMAGCAATRIVALPTALVGSIGVLSLQPVIPQLLERIGVKIHVTKGGHLKDMGAFYREPTEEETRKEEALVNELYEWFVATVADARKLDKERVLQIATGEAWTAATAKKMGLVDELGDLDTAINLAAQAAQVRPHTFYLRPRRPLLERLLAPQVSALTEAVLGEVESHLTRRLLYFL